MVTAQATTNNPNKALWEKGDFTRIAETMRASGRAMVATLGIRPHMLILDLGCGDGTTAIPMAKLGANVMGVDIASNLVIAGNRRAQEEKLSNIAFRVGDACDLIELTSGCFHKVVTIFGAMFSQRPLDVAKEMVRVTRPGGEIIMGNWIPGDPSLVSQILKITSAYTLPPPANYVSPLRWGVESEVFERFEQAGIKRENILFAKNTYTFDFGGTPAEFVKLFRTYYGPTMNAFEAAERDGKAERLQQELEDLFTRQNRSLRPNRTLIPATFLRVTVEVE